jgi:hypothetical protein
LINQNKKAKPSLNISHNSKTRSDAHATDARGAQRVQRIVSRECAKNNWNPSRVCADISPSHSHFMEKIAPRKMPGRGRLGTWATGAGAM